MSTFFANSRRILPGLDFLSIRVSVVLLVVAYWSYLYIRKQIKYQVPKRSCTFLELIPDLLARGNSLRQLSVNSMVAYQLPQDFGIDGLSH
jgi:hypothetical protein